MKVIKFTLKSNFSFFKNKEHISANHSYPTIPKTYVIGALGGLIGLNGFHSYSKNYKQLNNSILEIEKQINKKNIYINSPCTNVNIYIEIINNIIHF